MDNCIFKNKFKNFCKFGFDFIGILTLLFNIIQSKDECERDKPIFNGSSCQLKYCTKEDFNNNVCQINNTIIKTQWLNNIINIGDPSFRYVMFASYSNGDLIFETVGYPDSMKKKRIFYGFKNDGRGLFINNEANENFYYKSMNISRESYNYESKNIIIKQSANTDDENEYLLSISKEKSNVEIYDFKNDKIYLKNITIFSKINVITSFLNTAVALYSNNTDYKYLFGFIGKNNSGDVKYFIQIHQFKDIKNFENSETLIITKEIETAAFEKSGLSCFQTGNQIIICFFLITGNYTIIAFNTRLERLTKTDFAFDINIVYNYNNNPFYKCIHLKKEIGIFAYFNNNNPHLLFKEYQDSPLKINDYKPPEIKLDKAQEQFNIDIVGNDIIKLSDNKISFCTSSKDKTKIYIILINLFNEDKYKVRYYLIEISQLYNYIFHYDIGMHNYNNLIAFGFSCFNQSFDQREHINSFSALLIFSYPNSSDNYLYLDNYLYNYSSINFIEINLEKDVIIQNNIFGYVFSGIQIINLTNCDNFQLISSTSNSSIVLNYTLKHNEKIKFKFNENKYDLFVCNLHYIYKIKEPNLSIYDEYPIYLDGFNETDDNFTKTEYSGRLTYYHIKLNQSLTTECNEFNCSLCLNNTSYICIIYNNRTENSVEVSNIISSSVNSENYYTEKSEYISNIISSSVNSENYNTENYEDKYNIIPSSVNSEYYNTDTDTNVCDNNNKIENNIYSDYVEIIDGVEIIKRELKESKEELVQNLTDLMNSIEIGKNYKMFGNDYTMIIKPTTTFIPNSTYVDFLSCENILRSHYNISSSRIITFLQLEINNNNDKSLTNQIEYQAYDDNKKKLNLSLCNNTNIQIYYLIKSNSSINISFISSFKDLNIDLLNINDSFFNDICVPYSDSENDLILEDRVKDLYQNYSFCDDGCSYNNINTENMTIICDCKVKNNITTDIENIDLIKYEEVYKSSMFEIIKCYNLVFCLKNKLNNIGFWIFTILVLTHIILLIIYYYNGIKPIKKYIMKEMIEYGYLKKIKNKKENKKDNKNKKDKKKDKTKNNNKRLDDKKLSIKNKKIGKNESKINKESKIKAPPKKLKINNIKNKNKNRKKLKDKNFTKNNESSSYIQILNNKKKNNSLSIAQTEGKIEDKNYSKEKNNKNNKNNTINLNLINININNIKSYQIADIKSNHILNIYCFEEAIKNDRRSFFRILYIYLLAKQVIFHAFLYKSPLVLFPVRFCILIFIISSDLALNALFYFDDKISEKYRYAKSFFLFAFSNNITVILLSTFIGFIFLTLFIKLSNSSNNIRNIFKNEEEKIKKNKKYVVTDHRKKEIMNEIETILKNYKIKIFIFFIIQLILIIFFWYYVTVFCHVYSSTQMSWLWDSLLSMLSRLIIDLLLCFGFAKLYRIAVDSNIHCLYKISLFFYSFG